MKRYVTLEQNKSGFDVFLYYLIIFIIVLLQVIPKIETISFAEYPEITLSTEDVLRDTDNDK